MLAQGRHIVCAAIRLISDSLSWKLANTVREGETDIREADTCSEAY